LKKERLINRILLILKIIPILIMVTLIVLIAKNLNTLTISKILNYVPSNYFLAVLTILILYIVKSLSVVFPLALLCISSGVIFTPIYGIFINIFGLFLAVSVPYWIGRFCGTSLFDKLSEKYEKIEKINDLKNNNEYFLPYILRIIGILPCDIVSLALGSLKIDYKKYAIASVIGLMPRMIVNTLIGQTISNPSISIFILTTIFTISLSVFSIYIHNKYKKNKYNKL